MVALLRWQDSVTTLYYAFHWGGIDLIVNGFSRDGAYYSAWRPPLVRRHRLCRVAAASIIPCGCAVDYAVWQHRRFCGGASFDCGVVESVSHGTALYMQIDNRVALVRRRCEM
jgi:hypothetical protein